MHYVLGGFFFWCVCFCLIILKKAFQLIQNPSGYVRLFHKLNLILPYDFLFGVSFWNIYLDFIARFTLLAAFQCIGIFKQRIMSN